MNKLQALEKYADLTIKLKEIERERAEIRAMMGEPVGVVSARRSGGAVQRRIMEVLTAEAKPLRRNEIIVLAGMKKDSVESALEALVKRKTLWKGADRTFGICDHWPKGDEPAGHAMYPTPTPDERIEQ